MRIRSEQNLYTPGKCSSTKGLSYDPSFFRKYIGFDSLNAFINGGSVIAGEDVVLRGGAMGMLCENIGVEEKEYVKRYKPMDPEVYFVRIHYRDHSKNVSNTLDGPFTITLSARDFFSPKEMEKISKGEGLDRVEFTLAFGVQKTNKKSPPTGFLDRIFGPLQTHEDNQGWRRIYRARVLPAQNGVAHFSNIE
jgi:hypothetical protein